MPWDSSDLYTGDPSEVVDLEITLWVSNKNYSLLGCISCAADLNISIRIKSAGEVGDFVGYDLKFTGTKMDLNVMDMQLNAYIDAAGVPKGLTSEEYRNAVTAAQLPLPPSDPIQPDI